MSERDWKDDYINIGWIDYLVSTTGEFKPLVDSRGVKHTDNQRQWYQEGWQAAESAEKKQGRLVFLLSELIKWMEAGEEWYGSSFDDPITLVKKALAAYSDYVSQEKIGISDTVIQQELGYNQKSDCRTL